MDGYPGTFESFLRNTDGKEFKEITTSEENGVSEEYDEWLDHVVYTPEGKDSAK